MNALLAGVLSCAVMTCLFAAKVEAAPNPNKDNFKAAKQEFKQEVKAAKENFKADMQEYKAAAEYRNARTNVVPLPETLLLFGAGFAGFAAWRWRSERTRKKTADRKGNPF